MKQSRSTKTILRLSAWSGILALGLTAQAATVIQIDSNGVGESWLDTTTWDNASVPTAGNDYVCQTNNWDLRSPVADTPIAFEGDSLTFTNGARFKSKLNGNAAICTINNLTFWAGSQFINGQNNATLTGNQMNVKGTGSFTLDMEGDGRMTTFEMPITVDPTIDTITVYASGSGKTGSGSGFVLSNPANIFTGLWDVQEGLLQGAGLGTADFYIGSNGILNFDSEFSSSSSDLSIAVGGVVVLDQNITVNSLTVWGIQVEADTYTGAELKAEAYGSAFEGSHDAATLTVLSGPVVVTGDTIYQTADMTPGIDWNNTNYWNNGLAPISTNDYVNDNGGISTNNWSTRTPESGGGSFGGNSLNLTNSAKLNIKGNGPWTINTLNIWADSIINNGGAPAAEIAGGLNLLGSGSVILDAQTPGRKTTINSLLTAEASITNIIVQISQVAPTNTADAIGGGFIVNGPLNEFNGVWVVKEGLLQGTGFGSGSFLITDMGQLDFDSSYINPSADLTVEANPTNAALNGLLLLDQNVQVGSATLAGASLPTGSYTGAELKAHPTYSAVISPDTSDLAILAVGASAALPVYQIASANPWTDATKWDNGLAPTNIYAYINPGFELRNPNVADPVFGGKSLTMDSGSTLKLQSARNVTITNFTVYANSTFKTVGNTSLNGDLAILGSGSILWDVESIRTLTVNSEMTVAPAVTTFTIRASQTELAGIAGGVVVTEPDNTFTGEWIIEEGFLKGPGVGQSSFHVWESGYLAIGAAYSNEAANLTIDANPTNALAFGQMLLEYDMTVGSATIAGTELEAGEYTGEELKTLFGDMIAPASSDTAILKVTFIPDVPAIGDVEVSMSGSDLVMGWVATNYVTYTVQADDNLVLEPAWYITVTNITGVDGPVSITNNTTADPTLFYRVIGN
jgi:hypothetical protein